MGPQLGGRDVVFVTQLVEGVQLFYSHRALDAITVLGGLINLLVIDTRILEGNRNLPETPQGTDAIMGTECVIAFKTSHRSHCPHRRVKT